MKWFTPNIRFLIIRLLPYKVTVSLQCIGLPKELGKR